MLNRKTNIFVTILFTFVAFMLIGTTNVNAATVEVSNEQQLKAALDGVKEVEGGSSVDDTETTYVKLTEDITLAEYLDIIPVTNLTLDLNGHTIDGESNSKSIGITYGTNGRENFNSGSLTIIDSSSSKEGTIKSYEPIGISNGNSDTTSTKNFELTIEGGKFYSLYRQSATMFELSSNDYYMKDKNITFDFQVNDGYFEVAGSQTILFNASSFNTNNVTLNVNYDKLTFKGSQGRLIYSDMTFTVNDVVSADSNIKLISERYDREYVLEDRTLSVSEYGGLWSVVNDYNTIEITKAEGFDVADVTFEETYGYTSGKSESISIKNRGQNPLQVKSVTLSGEHADKFAISGSTQPTINSGETNSEAFCIEDLANGFNAGTYTATIIVTDINDKTYTSTVTLEVKRKRLEGISISKTGWTYDGTAHTGYTKSGLDGVDENKYRIDFSVKDAGQWSDVIPKKAGTYTIRLTIVDSNLVEESVQSDFTIAQNNTEIQIIASNNEWFYDGNVHNDTDYTVKFGGSNVANGLLTTSDIVTAVISGEVKDVKDTVTGNNVVVSFTITDNQGIDVTDSYSNKTTTNGTLKIKPIATPIIVTASGEQKTYDGTALRNNNYTYTDGILLSGDTLVVTISGEQTYAGTSENKVKSVKVMRGNKDITKNYTFGEHVNGSLKVTTASQIISIPTQYVAVGQKLTTQTLKDALQGAHGNVSFSVYAGEVDVGEYNEELFGGFRAGDIAGTVVMFVRVSSLSVGGDDSFEYNEATTTFEIHVVKKEDVTFNQIAPAQLFTYNGSRQAPIGVFVIDDLVPPGELEVSYAGTLNSGDAYNSTNAPINVGIYSVTYKVPDSNPSYMGQITYNFTIVKATYPKVTISGATTFEYTGSAIRPSANGFINNQMKASGDIEKTDVGNYTIIVELNDKFNYAWGAGNNSDDLELHWSITKVAPTIEISNLSQTVGSIVEPTYTVAPEVTNGTVKVEYKLSTADDSTYAKTLPTAAGTYSVRVSVTGDKNLENKSEVATLEITRKTTGGGGGGSSTTTYTITVEENKNAEVTPNGKVKVEKGDDKTFKITAKEGYEIEDVLVDGKSVGAVSEYTFENVKAKHTLSVKVKKVEEKPTTPEVKETFKDVKKNEWYFEAIEYVAKKGLMNGTGNDMFSPNEATTRGMIVTILYRLEGEPEVEECSFTDVPSGAYYAKAIAWAEKNGIVSGYGDGKFGPDDEITREQLATIMYRYSMYKKYDTSVGEDTNILSYNDIQDLAEYAFPAMQYACGDGLISGMGDGNLAPKGNATRAQVATILMRYCEKYMK